MSIIEVARTYRDRLASRDEEAESSLHAAYRAAWEEIEDLVQDLVQEIADQIAAGRRISPGALYRMERYRILQAQLSSEIERIVSGLGPSIAQMQSRAVVLGIDAADAMFSEAGVEPRVRLPNEQLIDMVGRLSNGQPLSDLLNELPGDAGERVRRALLNGIATGQGPRTVARNIRGALGGNMARALRIARTEVVSSYRNANLKTFQTHERLLQGWTWTAAITNTRPRPCAMCLAMHGTVHPLDEPFASHPSCRCVPTPLLKGRQPLAQPGEDWFDGQAATVKRDILGPSKLAAYQDGAITLTDLVAQGTDPRWGPWRREASLRSVVGAERARQFRRRPLAVAAPRVSLGDTLKQAEDEIRRLPNERAIVITPDGRRIFTKDGGKSQVMFTPEEMQQFGGNILTHNHPSGWDFAPDDPRRQGNSFSRADITLASVLNMAEIRATTPTWTYSMKPPAGGWNREYWDAVIQPALAWYERAVMQEFQTGISTGTMSIPEAESRHWHEVWSRVARELKLNYSRESVE